MADKFDPNFSFSQQLWYYYSTNRGKIRSRYNDLTRKFLAYNDSVENPHAFLRKPQFEALEMYVFVKEFMNNKQVYEMFDDWRHRRDRFSDASYYAVDKGGQIRLFDAPTEKQTDTLCPHDGTWQNHPYGDLHLLRVSACEKVSEGQAFLPQCPRVRTGQDSPSVAP